MIQPVMDRWTTVKRIHQSALDVDPSERAAFVDESCGGDEALRRDSEEVRAIPPFDSIDIDQAQVRLVHQRRCLQRVIGPLLAHIAPCETVQLLIN